MGLVIKESIKSTITSFSGALLGLLTMILSVKFFSQSEYGFYQTIIKNCTILGYVFILGFDYSLLILGQRFGQDPEKKSAFLRYTIIIPLIFITISCLGFFIFKNAILNEVGSEELYYYQDYYSYFPVITFLYLILYWCLGFLRSKNQSTFAYFIQDVVIRLVNIFIIVLFGYGFLDFTSFMTGLIISVLIPVILALKATISHKEFNLKLKNSLTLKEKKYILKFSFYHMMVVLASMLIFHIDSFIFPFISSEGLVNVGIFSICLYVMSVIRMPLRVVGLNATPTLTQYYDNQNQQKLKELFLRSSLNLQLLGGMLCVLIIVNLSNLQWILDYWKVGYSSFTDIIPILIIGVWVEMSLGISFEMIGISNYYKYTFWISLFYLTLSIILFWIFTEQWGLVGSAWAFSISLTFFSFAKTIFVIKKLGLSPWNGDTIKVVVLNSILLLCSLAPTFFNPIVDIIIKSTFIMIAYFVVSVRWSIGEDVQHIYRKLKSKFS